MLSLRRRRPRPVPEAVLEAEDMARRPAPRGGPRYPLSHVELAGNHSGAELTPRLDLLGEWEAAAADRETFLETGIRLR